jgi:tetratricopeptide (TPR) repeat protein
VRLSLTLPSDWPRELSVSVGALILLPDDIRRWIDRVMREGTSVGTRVEITANRELTTDTGWPLRLVEAKVTSGEAAQLVELRLGAFYAFQEHGAAALARFPDPATLEARRAEIVRAFTAARPDFSGQVACLAELTDIAPSAATATTAPAASPASVSALPTSARRRPDAKVLAEMLARAENDPSPEAALARGELLLELGRPADALAALASAPPTSAHAWELRGEAHAAQVPDRLDEAIAAWDRAAELQPDLAAAFYNAAQARYQRGDFAGALAGWRRVVELAPDDVLALRKVLQAEFALGRYDDAEATRRLLRQRWAESRDPRVRLLSEVVFDQFSAGPIKVHAYETLRNEGRAAYQTIYTFRAVDGDGRDLPVQVFVETSEYARERGTPFVLATSVRGRYRAVGAAPALPPYPELKQTVIQLINEGLAPAPPSAQSTQ